MNMQADLSQATLNTPPFYRSIRTLFIIAFVLAVVIPALIITVLTAVIGIQTSLSKATDQLEAISTLKSAQVGFWVNGLQTDLSRYTQDETLLLLVRQGLPDSLFPTRRDEAREELREAFRRIMEQSQDYESVFVTTIAGQVFATTNAMNEGTSFGNLPNFKNDPTQPYIQPPQFLLSTSEPPRVLVFVPIIDRGELLAVMGSTVNLAQIDEIMLENAGLGETGETYLVGANKLLLTRSRFEGFSMGRTTIDTPATTSATLELTSGTGNYDSYREEPVVGAYTWIPQLGVALIAEQTQIEILTPTRVTLVSSTVITILAVAAVLAVGLLVLERRITIPLVQLSNAAKEISEGNLQTHVEINQKDEIGMLANTFNQMSQNIQKRTQDLVRANAMAQESARLKSEFMSTMSHELRTPLNAILGFTGIMIQGMSGEIDDKAARMIQRISSNGQRLLSLIDDILNIAKIEAGRLELAQEPFDPHLLAGKLHTQLGGLADQKGLAFNVEISQSVPDTLYGDEGRIAQIITNLLSNAFKFTHHGEVSLRMDWKDEDWIVQVSDTGIGIPPHATNIIFEAFRQVDGTSRRVYGGSGLGLAICRNLCTMMNGSIRVESGLGRGSTFTITLPLPTTDPAESQFLTEASTIPA